MSVDIKTLGLSVSAGAVQAAKTNNKRSAKSGLRIVFAFYSTMSR